MSSHEPLYEEIESFARGSAAGLLQVLVAAARRTTFQRIVACPTYPVPAKTTGLSAAVRKLRDAMLISELHLPTFFARLYSSVRRLEDRKRTGQFFTSAAVADWALSFEALGPSDDVCDAGAGTAVFADAIIRGGALARSYTGVENDPILSLCAAHVLENLNAPCSYKIWYANFLSLRPADFVSRELPVPNVIIANPPFVRFHNLKGRVRIRAALKASLGVTISPWSGSGSYFMSRAAELAGAASSSRGEGVPKKRLIFFLPKEAAGAAHVQHLRDDLQRLHGWTWRQLSIPDRQTGIDNHRSNSLALLFVLKQEQLVAEGKPQERAPGIRVQDIIRVKRGISTGCNEFFVLTDAEVRRRGIPKKRLHEVLPTRIPISTDEFSKADWDLLRASHRPCWLLVLPDANVEDFEPSIKEYLREGLRRGVHETPTARSLRRWFSIPMPPEPPDLFVTYMFRGAPRFILNRARVLHLTNILGGRFVRPNVDHEEQKAIIDSLNIQARRWIEQNMAGREYKGGLIKIEPRELSMLPLEDDIARMINWDGLAVTSTSGSLFG